MNDGWNNLIPPIKGEVRNPKGKPKGTLHSATVIRKLWSRPTDVTLDGGKVVRLPRMYKSIQAALEKADEGDIKAINELLNRLEGKSLERVQTQEVKSFETHLELILSNLQLLSETIPDYDTALLYCKLNGFTLTEEETAEVRKFYEGKAANAEH